MLQCEDDMVCRCSVVFRKERWNHPAVLLSPSACAGVPDSPIGYPGTTHSHVTGPQVVPQCSLQERSPPCMRSESSADSVRGSKFTQFRKLVPLLGRTQTCKLSYRPFLLAQADTKILQGTTREKFSLLKRPGYIMRAWCRGIPSKTVMRRGSLVFCRQAKVPKSNASALRRWSVKSVFVGIFRHRCSSYEKSGTEAHPLWAAGCQFSNSLKSFKTTKIGQRLQPDLITHPGLYAPQGGSFNLPFLCHRMDIR
ncbi:MAG: hypothetical protein A4E62_02355 [Syntrophorhabdus sp. PtaU1.Bin002]|nr:MAG: hypothetical protein A4E62_02355 [Syntrophorhabdus sp. PtaU1.Bin002]